ncbi:MAG: hypothetical protein J0H06_14565, partial [Actinobacteria bacterium]|nr:hypothetical protein [Actinomycetota bacterium]
PCPAASPLGVPSNFDNGLLPAALGVVVAVVEEEEEEEEEEELEPQAASTPAAEPANASAPALFIR